MAMSLFTLTSLRSPSLSTLKRKEGVCFRVSLLHYGEYQIKYFLHIYFMPSIIDLCRELRKRQTPAEELLWEHLRNRSFHSKKFLRQHPIYVETVFGKSLYYIPDFYCHKAKLVIEADGPIHLYKKEYDKNRDEVLGILGLKILRFENEQILNDTKMVLNLIKINLV